MFYIKALLLVNPTVLEIFYQGSVRKALLLVNPTVLCRNILPRFCTKSPPSGKYYSTRNVIPRVCTKYPTFG